MKYKVGDKVRVKQIYPELSGKNHYVTREMAKLSNRIVVIATAEQYFTIARYRVRLFDDTVGFFEEEWLAPVLLDNRSI